MPSVTESPDAHPQLRCADTFTLAAFEPITIFIEGLPRAFARPRSTAWQQKDGRIRSRVYPDAVVERWKERAAWLMKSQVSRPIPGLIKVDVLIVYPCPVSEYRARTKRARRWGPSKADGDNVLKAVLDAGNKVLWPDDAQVVDGHYLTVIGAQDEKPGVWLRLERPGLVPVGVSWASPSA